MQSSQGLRCRDLKADRNIGSFWEERFLEMAVAYGCVAEGKQKGRTSSAVAMSPGGGLILPDTQVSKGGITVLAEIKHKDPTRHGQYGYEQYRLEDLVESCLMTGLETIIAIHDHSLAGGKNVMQNHIAHWRWQNVSVLNDAVDFRAPGWTWFNGEKVVRTLLYWDVSRFAPLSCHPFFAGDNTSVVRRDPSRPVYQKSLLGDAKDGR